MRVLPDNYPIFNASKDDPMKYVVLVAVIVVFAAASNAQTEMSAVADGTGLLHKVQQGETIFSISKKYVIEQKELLRANPELVMGLRTGQELRIPLEGRAGERIKGSVTPVNPDRQERLPSFETYKAGRGESLYSIAKRFGIEVEDILKYNPEARDGIRRGQILMIPDRDDLAAIRVQEQEEAVQPVPGPQDPAVDSLIVEQDMKRPCEPDPRASTETYRIGLLLDFYLPANDTMNKVRVTMDELTRDSLLLDRGSMDRLTPDPFRKRDDVTVYSRSENFIHFYEGVLLATDSMQRAGMNIQLHVYDTNQKQYVVDSLVRSGSLDGLDLMIGPTFPELQRRLTDFTLKNRIPMISPLSSSGNFEAHHPWYFKVNPDRQYLIDKTADYLAEAYSDANFIVLRVGAGGNSPEAELVKLVRERLGHFGPSSGHGRFHEYRLSSDAEGLKALLFEDRENVFIIPSETEAQISVAVTTLNALAETYPVTLVGLSNYNRYRSIQTEYFHRTKLTYLTPYFVDYRSPEVNRFIRKFRHQFAAEPNQYSFQGYDVAFYFMSALFRYGKDFTGCLPMLRVSLTQSELAFDRVSPDGGYRNSGLFIVHYEPGFEISAKGVVERPFDD